MTIAPNSGLEIIGAKKPVKSDFPSAAQNTQVLRIKSGAILETLVRS